MGEPKRIWETTRIIKSVRVFVPKERMLIVNAGKDDDNGELFHWTDPVLGIRVRLYAEYSWSGYQGGSPPSPGATHAEMIANGWCYSGQEEDYEPLVVSDESYVEADDSPNRHSGALLVVCTWPEDQDAEKLVPFIETAKKYVR